MNENIDLTEILKNCPRGWELWSPIMGDVIFKEIKNNAEYAIFVTYGTCESSFTREGYFYAHLSEECLLFPSKDQRDWSKFTAPWYNNDRFNPKTLKPFDRVIASSYCDDEWDCDIFSHINQEYSFPYVCIGQAWKCCIPYNDDTKHLVGTTDEAPEYYRYWED